MTFYLFIPRRGQFEVTGISRLTGPLRVQLSQYSAKHGEDVREWHTYSDLALSVSEDARFRKAYAKFFN